MNGMGMTFRRRLLAVALPGVALQPTAAMLATVAIDSAADQLAAAMAVLHGGQWKARVDHDAGFVLIVPLPEKPPPA